MRRGPLIFLLIFLVLIASLVRSVFTLICLLFEDGSMAAIHQLDLPSPNSSSIDIQKPSIIPKIIHQTYKNERIPEIWHGAQQSCVDLHPDYTYVLWTDQKAREFIAEEYPWFLETFDAYEYPIQRADTIRYFVLAHFGGIYIDLDDGCNRRLDPLLVYPAWLRRTVPTGISNDVMGSVPHHPFFLRVIEMLQSYDRSWLLPYITVMYSTGPLFLSVIWKEYMQEQPVEEDRVCILMQAEYKQHPWSFFTHHIGSSWHGKDARLIFWMGENWILLTICGVILACLVVLGLWWIASHLIPRSSKHRYRYSISSDAVPSQARPRLPRRARRSNIIPRLFRSVNSSELKDVEAVQLTKESYELYDRRD